MNEKEEKKEYAKDMGRIEDETLPKDSIYKQGYFPCAKCGEMTLWTQLVVEKGHTYGDGSGICTRCALREREE